MRLFAMLLVLAAFPALAADMPQKIRPAPPPPVVLVPENVCITGRPVEVYIEPEGRSNGILPAGIEVEVVEFPWSRSIDLWVRIRPPRESLYYGWVFTRNLACL